MPSGGSGGRSVGWFPASAGCQRTSGRTCSCGRANRRRRASTSPRCVGRRGTATAYRTPGRPSRSNAGADGSPTACFMRRSRSSCRRSAGLSSPATTSSRSRFPAAISAGRGGGSRRPRTGDSWTGSAARGWSSPSRARPRTTWCASPASTGRACGSCRSRARPPRRRKGRFRRSRSSCSPGRSSRTRTPASRCRRSRWRVAGPAWACAGRGRRAGSPGCGGLPARSAPRTASSSPGWSRTAASPRSGPERSRCWCRRSRRASACRSSRRWPPGRRRSRATPRPCARPGATPPGTSRRATQRCGPPRSTSWQARRTAAPSWPPAGGPRPRRSAGIGPPAAWSPPGWRRSMADEPPLVLVDGRVARRRRTGVARHVRGLEAAIGGTSHDALRVSFSYGPPGVPRRGVLTTAANLLLDSLWLHVCIPALAAAHRAALVHAPVNWAPLWSPCPTVVTIHDLAWERMPEAFPRAFRAWARLLARRSVRRARLVIAVSNATALDVGAIYGVPAERIRVIPNGVDLPPPSSAPREPFVLAVGEFEPRKRVLELIEGHRAYYHAAPPDPPPCRLVIAGAGGSQEEAARAAAGPECELLGFVDDARLRDLYRRATLLAYPSAYEGFGLPVAEAMAAGCPVLVARNSALVEVGGDAALPIDDATPAGIAGALARALADRAELARRGAAGRAEAERLSWPRAAASTLAVWVEAIGREG